MTKTGSERKTAFIRTVLFILAAVLMFGGPTYLIYAMQKVNLPYSVSVLSGLIAFAVGILLFWRLIRKQTKLGVSE
jgi:cytochrome c biogenesis protein CcdA